MGSVSNPAFTTDKIIRTTPEYSHSEGYDNNSLGSGLRTEANIKLFTSDYRILDSTVDISNSKNKLYFSLLRKIIKTELFLSENQIDASVRLLDKLASYTIINNLKISGTNDSEIQLFRELNNGYTSLIIDEFGGITFLLMGKKGFGYKCEYFEYEKLDERNLHILSKDFATISL